jgi:hypothetical protein
LKRVALELVLQHVNNMILAPNTDPPRSKYNIVNPDIDLLNVEWPQLNPKPDPKLEFKNHRRLPTVALSAAASIPGSFMLEKGTPPIESDEDEDEAPPASPTPKHYEITAEEEAEIASFSKKVADSYHKHTVQRLDLMGSTPSR